MVPQPVQGLLRKLLDTTVVSCAPSIQASLAVRAAENYFPRFFIKSSDKEEWHGAESAMRDVQVRLDRSRRRSVSHYTCSSRLKVWEASPRQHAPRSVIWYT